MKVDFCVIDSNSKMQALRKLCDLLEAPYANNEPVFILTSTSQECDIVDKLLWTYKEDSFIAHEIAGENDEPAPVVIGAALPEKKQGVLVNLTTTIPESHQAFNRIMEIVFTDPVVQQSGRERYRQYRELGYELQTHKMKAN